MILESFVHNLNENRFGRELESALRDHLTMDQNISVSTRAMSRSVLTLIYISSRELLSREQAAHDTVRIKQSIWLFI